MWMRGSEGGAKQVNECRVLPDLNLESDFTKVNKRAKTSIRTRGLAKQQRVAIRCLFIFVTMIVVAISCQNHHLEDHAIIRPETRFPDVESVPDDRILGQNAMHPNESISVVDNAVGDNVSGEDDDQSDGDRGDEGEEEEEGGEEEEDKAKAEAEPSKSPVDFGGQGEATELVTGQPVVVHFDDDDEDTEADKEEDKLDEVDEDVDEEDFYNSNPLDQPSDNNDENINKDIHLGTALEKPFDDFDDHQALNSSSFYDNSDTALDSNDKMRTMLYNPVDEPETSASHKKKKKVKKIKKKVKKKMKKKKEKKKKKRKKKKGKKHKKEKKREKKEHHTGSQQSHVCAMMLQRGGCITNSAIELAVRKARRLLRYQQPSDLMSAEPSESSLNAVGELIEYTTRILAQRFHLSYDEVHFGMEQINVSLTSLWRQCPALFRTPPACPPVGRYRSHTGQCNNPLGPHLGSSYMSFARMLPADYADGIGIPRRSAQLRSELPTPRLLAINLHPDLDRPSSDLSTMFMAWGQLVNHDLALASSSRIQTGHDFSCCPIDTTVTARLLLANKPLTPRQRVCLPIQIGPGDPVYAPYRIWCHDFKRSIAGLRPGCTLGPRTQVNMITSFIDASFVYGSTRTMTASLRSNRRGQLAMQYYFRNQNLKPILPPQTANPDEECLGRRGGLFCFRSGDARTNQQILLATLHTVHARQHNRLAEALAMVNPHWLDQRLYHEARHIHIAMVQHILLSEYLPSLLGPKLTAKYNLQEEASGYWDHYDPSVNPGVSQAFAAAAFRQGHTTVPSVIYRFNYTHGLRRLYLLRSVYRQPWPLYEPFALDEFLLGALNSPSQSVDPFISTDLSGHLLQEPNQQIGLDLTAINIQRGRDQGVAGYNAYREWCGLGRVESFDQLDQYMSNASSHLMAQLYESVDDVDLFTGGLSEFPANPDSLVGPTFACIIGRQFEAIRKGDRFWFESSMGPHAFTPPQLEAIKSVTLARLICANSDTVVAVQQMALRLPHPILNPTVICNQLPDIDISLWYEPRVMATRPISPEAG